MNPKGAGRSYIGVGNIGKPRILGSGHERMNNRAYTREEQNGYILE
jgi:hypothetical protein